MICQTTNIYISPASVGPYGPGGPIPKGMEDPTAYGMTNDYSRAGPTAASAAAGYGAVPQNPGMRPASMEGGPPQMGMPANPGMYGATMSAAAAAAGYGGYGMNGAAMYPQAPQGPAGTTQGPRMGPDGGYGDSGYGVAGGAVGGNSNYGNRSQGSATSQARVDRSYRPY